MVRDSIDIYTCSLVITATVISSSTGTTVQLSFRSIPRLNTKTRFLCVARNPYSTVNITATITVIGMHTMSILSYLFAE